MCSSYLCTLPQVVLATAGYDHTIRFWEATSGLCYRTLQYADSQVLTNERRWMHLSAHAMLQKQLVTL